MPVRSNDETVAPKVMRSWNSPSTVESANRLASQRRLRTAEMLRGDAGPARASRRRNRGWTASRRVPYRRAMTASPTADLARRDTRCSHLERTVSAPAGDSSPQSASLKGGEMRAAGNELTSYPAWKRRPPTTAPMARRRTRHNPVAQPAKPLASTAPRNVVNMSSQKG